RDPPPARRLQPSTGPGGVHARYVQLHHHQHVRLLPLPRGQRHLPADRAGAHRGRGGRGVGETEGEGGHQALTQHPQARVPRRPRRHDHKHRAAEPDGARRRREAAHDGGERHATPGPHRGRRRRGPVPAAFAVLVRPDHRWAPGDGRARELVVGEGGRCSRVRGRAEDRDAGAGQPGVRRGEGAWRPSPGPGRRQGLHWRPGRHLAQVTLALQPLFKRSVTFVKRDDSDFADRVATWGRLHEFADMLWLPQHGKVVYRQDDRVDVSTPGGGLNDMLLFRANPTRATIAARAAEELLQENGTDTARCAAAQLQADTLEKQAYGFTNDGVSFTGYPVVGYQHRIQASGTCVNSPEDGLRSACGWDPRIPSSFNDNSGFSVALSKASAFIIDMQRLRDLNPAVFCAGVDPRIGVAFRYIKASSAYLGKAEDSIAVDIIYYRSHADGMPRVYADVVDEIEQIALRKYGALPHWGKNRNIAFDGAISKYPKAHEFLMVKDRCDPDGLFSSEWSDQVLGINGSLNIIKEHCAIEGLCVCSEDSHCAPELGYFCRPGKVYAKARVCSFGKDY
ncbi:hypothetical protein CFC21_110607, partial [Triticum aestivum]